MNEQLGDVIKGGKGYSRYSLDHYQRQAMSTAMGLATGEDGSPLHGAVYCALGLVGEAGEFSEKVKKAWRDDAELGEQAAQELGDVLWYLAAAASALGYSLSDIASMNAEKLASRKERDRLHGSGDTR